MLAGEPCPGASAAGSVTEGASPRAVCSVPSSPRAQSLAPRSGGRTDGALFRAPVPCSALPPSDPGRGNSFVGTPPPPPARNKPDGLGCAQLPDGRVLALPPVPSPPEPKGWFFGQVSPF